MKVGRLFHFNRQFSGQTVAWKGADSFELYQINIQDADRLARLQHWGWNQSNCITYRYNSEGFRTEEFDSRPCGLAFGCSFTEGVGVREQDTWPSRLTERSGLWFWNLGIGGAALDTIYRLFEHYIELLRPKIVVVCHPPQARCEYAVNDHVIRTVGVNSPEVNDHIFANFFKHYFLRDLNSEINWEKNLRLLEYIAQARGLPLIHAPMESDCEARDLQHPGPGCLDSWAEMINSQMQNKY